MIALSASTALPSTTHWRLEAGLERADLQARLTVLFTFAVAGPVIVTSLGGNSTWTNITQFLDTHV